MRRLDFRTPLSTLLVLAALGLPIAAQHLKMTRLALLPFGFEVRERL